MNPSVKSIVALVMLAIAVPAGATSVSGVKVTRLNRGTANDVFVQVSVPPSPRDCNGTLAANEVYVFDGETPNGRLLDALLLSAYSANKFIDIVGTGTCRSYSGGLFRYELIRAAVIR